MPLKLFLISVLLPLQFVFANEAPPPAHGGGAAAPVKEEPKPWLAIQAEVSGLKTKRQQLMQSFAHSAEAKAHVKPGSKEFREIQTEMNKTHLELQKVTEEYNKQLIILKYRFPERLAKEGIRTYEPVELPDAAELEHQLDLDARLNRTMEKARTQYSQQSAQSVDGRVPASEAAKQKAEEIKTLREEDALLLRK